MATTSEPADTVSLPRHRGWVRTTHWIIALAVLTLMLSGVTILMAHPRLYWGAAGNDLTQPLLALPIGPNGGGAKFGNLTPFAGQAPGVFTANRLAEPWNQNGWARSLHFLAAWFFLAGLFVYLVLALLTGHARRNVVPRRADLSRQSLSADVRAHLRLPMPHTEAGPPYSALQKIAYALIAFVALPLMVLTGITMSPAITAAWPWLLDLFGGQQSARTIHFASFAVIALFLLVHLAMIALTGPVRQLRAMITGR